MREEGKEGKAEKKLGRSEGGEQKKENVRTKGTW